MLEILLLVARVAVQCTLNKPILSGVYSGSNVSV